MNNISQASFFILSISDNPAYISTAAYCHLTVYVVYICITIISHTEQCACIRIGFVATIYASLQNQVIYMRALHNTEKTRNRCTIIIQPLCDIKRQRVTITVEWTAERVIKSTYRYKAVLGGSRNILGKGDLCSIIVTAVDSHCKKPKFPSCWYGIGVIFQLCKGKSNLSIYRDIFFGHGKYIPSLCVCRKFFPVYRYINKLLIGRYVSCRNFHPFPGLCTLRNINIFWIICDCIWYWLLFTC